MRLIRSLDKDTVLSTAENLRICHIRLWRILIIYIIFLYNKELYLWNNSFPVAIVATENQIHLEGKLGLKKRTVGQEK